MANELPKDLQAERAILGVILQKHTLLADIERQVPTTAYFADRSHQVLYEHMRALRDAGQPCNAVTAGGFLGQERRKEAAQYLAYCVRTADVDQWESYTSLVGNAYRCRTLIEQARRLEAAAMAGDLSASYACVESFNTTKYYPNGVLFSYADLPERTVNWAWPGYIMNGLAHLLFSWKSEGKTSVLLRICESFITGCPFPDGQPYVGETGKILMCDAESFQYQIRDRMLAMGLPLDSFICPTKPDVSFSFENQAHVNALTYIAAKPEIKFVIVDGLGAAQENAKENDPVAAKGIALMARLARDFGKPFLASHHSKKLGVEVRRIQGGMLSREDFRGSSAIIAQCRTVLAISRPDLESPKRVFHCVASNFEPPPALTFVIDETGAHFDGSSVPDPRPVSSLDMACSALFRILKNGAVLADKIREETDQQGLSWETVKRAKAKLDIISKKSIINPRQYFWSFPARETEEQNV